ncbi:MAG TPA: DNA-binding protein WhiA [Syntrophomonadaceae bacterium]|nr:DNA-binding protein WhiA [Syntrophomonadaceae bacterium]HNX29414.1 DNA-binding protein WhiA [Syntrophomonadaceae bacterium]HPR93850.1 DNA-binding protein WhiA [Syntrophomonadaceae bacterium]
MSFANDVRNELARLMPEKECCRKAELSALLLTSGQIHCQADNQYNLEAVVEKAATARKIFKMLKEQNLQSSVRMEKRKRFNKTRVYMVNTLIKDEQDFKTIEGINIIDRNLILKPAVNQELIAKTCCKKSYLRGLFLNRGFINRPEGVYHLELVINDAKLAADIQKMLLRFNIPARLGERKNSLFLYVKESEIIADFLRVVGASTALLEFENVRIIKAMRNDVNRQVNCETANLAKTVDAAVRQNNLIKELLNQEGWEGIPPQYVQLVQLRIDFPDSSLAELGKMMGPPLSKSGVAYRMRKLEEYAAAKLQSRIEAGFM